MSNPNWTTDEETRLRESLRAGETYEAIARSLGRSVKSVSGQITRLGLVRRVEKSWTQDEVSRLLELRLGGWSLAAIARDLGRSEKSVRVKLCRVRRRV